MKMKNYFLGLSLFPIYFGYACTLDPNIDKDNKRDPAPQSAAAAAAEKTTKKTLLTSFLENLDLNTMRKDVELLCNQPTYSSESSCNECEVETSNIEVNIQGNEEKLPEVKAPLLALNEESETNSGVCPDNIARSDYNGAARCVSASEPMTAPVSKPYLPPEYCGDTPKIILSLCEDDSGNWSVTDFTHKELKPSKQLCVHLRCSILFDEYFSLPPDQQESVVSSENIATIENKKGGGELSGEDESASTALTADRDVVLSTNASESKARLDCYQFDPFMSTSKGGDESGIAPKGGDVSGVISQISDENSLGSSGENVLSSEDSQATIEMRCPPLMLPATVCSPSTELKKFICKASIVIGNENIIIEERGEGFCSSEEVKAKLYQKICFDPRFTGDGKDLAATDIIQCQQE